MGPDRSAALVTFRCTGCGLVGSATPDVRARAPRALCVACNQSLEWKLGPFTLGAVHVGEALALLQKLPDGCVDAVVTDPPYSSGGFTRGDRAADPTAKYCQDGDALGRISFTGDNRDGRSWAYWSALWLSECQRVLRPEGYGLTFCDWRQLPLATDAFQAGGLVWRGLISWDKGPTARAPHSNYFRHQCEFVVWGTNGALPTGAAGNGGPWPGCEQVSIDRNDKHHMTGKPTELMRRLVRCVPPGSVVLDPFAGSGTTIVACELEGRLGIGFEKEPENVRISSERIRGARVGLTGRDALSNQVALFGTDARVAT